MWEEDRAGLITVDSWVIQHINSLSDALKYLLIWEEGIKMLNSTVRADQYSAWYITGPQKYLQN